MGSTLLTFVQPPFLHAFVQVSESALLAGATIAAGTWAAWSLYSKKDAREAVARSQRCAAIYRRRETGVIEASADCIQILDAKGICLSINTSGLAALGRTRAQVVGQSLLTPWPERARPSLAAALDLAARGQPNKLDASYCRADGEARAFELTLQPIFDELGKVETIACSAVDMTERQRVALEVLTAKNVAEAATQAKTEFLAVISHEIRTPLGGVIGMLDLLRKQSLNEQQKQYVSLAQDSAHMLVELLNDLLDHSKIEAGRLILEAIPFRPRVELTRVIECLRARAIAKDLDFSYEFSADVPEFLQGDPTRLRQAIANLLSNAIKFTSAGSVRVEISSAPARRAEHHGLSIRVIDTGPGISAEMQSRLFSKYAQADPSTSRVFGGSGLGLAIVKQISELMAGEITVLSDSGRGTTFHLFVQLPAPAPDVVEAVTAQSGAPMIPKQTHRLRVLCADDEMINRIIAEGFVSSMGHSVAFANNGEEVLEKLQDEDFDVVLMDSRMPKMDGIEATREIRSQESTARDHGIFIAATTADTSRAHREKCFAAGMNRFLVKPFHENELGALLQSVIECQLARGRELPLMISPDVPAPTGPLTQAPGLTEDEILAMMGPLEAIENEVRPPKPEIVLQYLRDAPARFAQMRTALKNGDFAALGLAAHSIKSISFYVAAHSLCELGRKIEIAADAQRLEEAESWLDQAETEFTEIRRKLTRATPPYHEAVTS